MLLSYKYRLYPTKDQEMRLQRRLRSLCDLYNELRSEKVEKYRRETVSLIKTDLRSRALERRRSSKELKLVHSEVAQNVADRVDMSFQRFFKGLARFPKNKKYKNYRSFTYPQQGFNMLRTPFGHKIYLSGIGKVRTFIHRAMSGAHQHTLSIKRQCDEWYAIFVIKPLVSLITPITEEYLDTVSLERISGSDLGLQKFIVLDNDSELPAYPSFLRRSERTALDR